MNGGAADDDIAYLQRFGQVGHGYAEDLASVLQNHDCIGIASVCSFNHFVKRDTNAGKGLILICNGLLTRISFKTPPAAAAAARPKSVYHRMPYKTCVPMNTAQRFAILICNAAYARPNAYVDEILHIIRQIQSFLHQAKEVNVIPQKYRNTQQLFKIRPNGNIVLVTDALNAH